MTAASTSPSPALTARALLEDPEIAPLVRIVAAEAGLERPITHPRIQKSGLALAGHRVGVVPSRVQILGETEISYLESLAPQTRAERLREFFGLELSCVVVTRGIEAPAEVVDAAARSSTPLAVATPRSSATIAAIHRALDRLLAPRQSVHGVMVEVHGIGILLVGPSGIGKSECALVLVERGHRLVADDRVELVRMPGGRIAARAAPLLRHHLEIRGLGILNVRDLFGATAVQEEAALDLVVELRPLDSGVGFDRLGIDDRTREVLGVAVPTVTIPVYPGRDMGVLLEVAARNLLLRRAGHHPARAFAASLSHALGVAGPDEAGRGPDET